ncbi:MAG TPA: 2'-5' RNA ligase family protein, partial [Actinomycetota bacterium]|nr:2'-5' RNA ligase family protein [Actinomycetota bacterium]
MARDRAAVPEAKPLRLFVAVDIPEAAKDLLIARTDRFRNRIPGARWTTPPGWHVTLKFLGATWPRLVEEVRAAVAE